MSINKHLVNDVQDNLRFSYITTCSVYIKSTSSVNLSCMKTIVGEKDPETRFENWTVRRWSRSSYAHVRDQHGVPSYVYDEGIVSGVHLQVKR